MATPEVTSQTAAPNSQPPPSPKTNNRGKRRSGHDEGIDYRKFVKSILISDGKPEMLSGYETSKLRLDEDMDERSNTYRLLFGETLLWEGSFQAPDLLARVELSADKSQLLVRTVTREEAGFAVQYECFDASEADRVEQKLQSALGAKTPEVIDVLALLRAHVSVPPSLLCISLGGARQEAIREQCKALGVEVEFCAGVRSSQLGIGAAALAAEVQDVLDDIGVEASEVVEGASKCDAEQLRVLACSFAHFRAMSRAVRSTTSFTLIIEDNVRAVRDLALRLAQLQEAVSGRTEGGDAAMCPASMRGADLYYAGYLGRPSDLREVHVADQAAPQVPQVPQVSQVPQSPLSAHKSPQGPPGSLLLPLPPGSTPLWGAYAYMVSRRAWNTLRAFLSEHRVSALFQRCHRKRRRPQGYSAADSHIIENATNGASTAAAPNAGSYEVVPVDRFIPRKLRAAGLRLVRCRVPLLFRMPPASLRSSIHPHLDFRFFEATTLQLRLTGQRWSDLWLPPDELAAAKDLQRSANNVTTGPALLTEDDGDGCSCSFQWHHTGKRGAQVLPPKAPDATAEASGLAGTWGASEDRAVANLVKAVEHHERHGGISEASPKAIDIRRAIFALGNELGSSFAAGEESRRLLFCAAVWLAESGKNGERGEADGGSGLDRCFDCILRVFMRAGDRTLVEQLLGTILKKNKEVLSSLHLATITMALAFVETGGHAWHAFTDLLVADADPQASSSSPEEPQDMTPSPRRTTQSLGGLERHRVSAWQAVSTSLRELHHLQASSQSQDAQEAQKINIQSLHDLAICAFSPQPLFSDGQVTTGPEVVELFLRLKGELLTTTHASLPSSAPKPESPGAARSRTLTLTHSIVAGLLGGLVSAISPHRQPEVFKELSTSDLGATDQDPDASPAPGLNGYKTPTRNDCDRALRALIFNSREAELFAVAASFKATTDSTEREEYTTQTEERNTTLGDVVCEYLWGLGCLATGLEESDPSIKEQSRAEMEEGDGMHDKDEVLTIPGTVSAQPHLHPDLKMICVAVRWLCEANDTAGARKVLESTGLAAQPWVLPLAVDGTNAEEPLRTLLIGAASAGDVQTTSWALDRWACLTRDLSNPSSLLSEKGVDASSSSLRASHTYHPFRPVSLRVARSAVVKLGQCSAASADPRLVVDLVARLVEMTGVSLKRSADDQDEAEGGIGLEGTRAEAEGGDVVGSVHENIVDVKDEERSKTEHVRKLLLPLLFDSAASSGNIVVAAATLEDLRRNDACRLPSEALNSTPTENKRAEQPTPLDAELRLEQRLVGACIDGCEDFDTASEVVTTLCNSGFVKSIPAFLAPLLVRDGFTAQGVRRQGGAIRVLCQRRKWICAVQDASLAFQHSSNAADPMRASAVDRLAAIESATMGAGKTDMAESQLLEPIRIMREPSGLRELALAMVATLRFGDIRRDEERQLLGLDLAAAAAAAAAAAESSTDADSTQVVGVVFDVISILHTCDLLAPKSMSKLLRLWVPPLLARSGSNSNQQDFALAFLLRVLELYSDSVNPSPEPVSLHPVPSLPLDVIAECVKQLHLDEAPPLRLALASAVTASLMYETNQGSDASISHKRHMSFPIGSIVQILGDAVFSWMEELVGFDVIMAALSHRSSRVRSERALLVQWIQGDQEKQAACVSWLRKAGGSPAAEVAAWLEQRQHSKGR